MGQPTPPADPGATPPATDPTAPPAAPPATGDGLGDAGKKALTELRQANKDLERQLKELQARDPVKAIADALGMKPQDPKDDKALAEQVRQIQQQMRDAELRAARLEVAAAKGLTPLQAMRLQGATREELEADADQLKELFPATASATPGTPAPDPSQGARGGGNQLQAALTAAQAKGDVKEAIRLKTLIAAQRTKP